MASLEVVGEVVGGVEVAVTLLPLVTRRLARTMMGALV